ncbi:MAG: hypothetical protein AAF409_08580 [Pseudomonadota bacterium]
MNMLLSELQVLAYNPWAWAVVGVLALFSTHAVIQLLACPYARGTATISDTDMSQAQNSKAHPGARFGLTMLGGAALTVTGLFMIAKGISPAIALAAVVGGIVLIQTEPARLSIRQQTYAVISHRDATDEARENARERLRGSHRALASINVFLLLAVVAAMLAFKG